MKSNWIFKSWRCTEELMGFELSLICFQEWANTCKYVVVLIHDFFLKKHITCHFYPSCRDLSSFVQQEKNPILSVAAIQFDLVEVVCLCAYIYQRKLLCILKSSLFSFTIAKSFAKETFWKLHVLQSHNCTSQSSRSPGSI